MNTPQMPIDIWSDFTCPFCYIGKVNIEKAIHQMYEKEHISVNWHSFQLNPQAKPLEREDLFQFYLRTEGRSLEANIQEQQNAISLAKGTGINFKFEIAKPANTLLAHRLLQLSKKYQKADEVGSLLYAAHFSLGKNIQDSKIIIEIGTQAQLPVEALENLVHTKAFEVQVEQDRQQGIKLGVQSVPCYVFDNKYGIIGAQSVDTFSEQLEKAYIEWENINF